MAIVWMSGLSLTGLSTDTKPTNVQENVTFAETDTRSIFNFNGTTWDEIAVGKPIEYSLVRSADYARSEILTPFENPTKITDPSSLPSDPGGMSFSPDGQFLAAADFGTPFIIIYQRIGAVFTKLPDPATIPTGIGNRADFSPDGQFMVVSHFGTPFITIYQIEGTTFTKLSDPATLPAGVAFAAAFSPNNEFLAIAHATAPFITIYQIEGTTFTKLSDPATLPNNQGQGVTFSPDGQFLAVVHASSPFITIYQIEGTTFTKLSDPATLPAGSGRGVSFSPNGQFMAVVHTNTPFITIYIVSGTTFTKLSDPATLPAGSGRGVSFSPNGQFLSVAHVTTPFITIYQRDPLSEGVDTTFIKLSDPDTLPTGDAQATDFSPNNEFISVSHVTAPILTIYQSQGVIPTRGTLDFRSIDL